MVIFILQANFIVAKFIFFLVDLVYLKNVKVVAILLLRILFEWENITFYKKILNIKKLFTWNFWSSIERF